LRQIISVTQCTSIKAVWLKTVTFATRPPSQYKVMTVYFCSLWFRSLWPLCECIGGVSLSVQICREASVYALSSSSPV